MEQAYCVGSSIGLDVINLDDNAIIRQGELIALAGYTFVCVEYNDDMIILKVTGLNVNCN